MPVVGRQLILALVTGAFVLQTWLIYADDAGRTTPPLSELAVRGREVWHERNCQSCHQIYGFGGFLGPDLTNAAPSLSPARIDSVLTEGAGQMPAFHLPPSDRKAVMQFLLELDKTGVSQPRIKKVRPPEELFTHLVAAITEKQGALTGSEALGHELMVKQNCVGCHLPNHASLHRASDLTTAAGRLGRDGVGKVLAEGVPGKPMPKFAFNEAERAAVFDFLAWMEKHGERYRSEFEVTRGGGAWSLLDVPWFEYE